MKRLFALTLLLISAAISLAQDGFQIDRFDAVYELRPNGEMQVEERIAVTFTETKRGIFRDVPVDYDTGKTTRRVTIKFQSVTDGDGNRLQTKVKRSGPNLNIRIGDPDIYLDPGTKITYVIRYVAFGMINWFEDSADWKSEAQLYWNVTGDQWTTSIAQTSFVVHFPKSSKPSQNRLAVYPGPYGSTESVLQNGPGTNTNSTLRTSISLTDSEAKGDCMSVLNPGAGLTVVLGIPPELIAKPTLMQRFELAVLPNLGFLLPLLVFPIMWFLWTSFGKDPYGGPMVVQYDPPDNLSGPEAGAMVDERVDDRDIAASIVALAVKGYLTITPDETGTIFKRKTMTLKATNKPAGPELTRVESEMLDYILLAGGEVDESDMKTHVAPNVSRLRELVYQDLVGHGYYMASPDGARIGWFIGCGLVVAGLAFLTFVLSPFDNPMPAIVGGVISVVIVGLFANSMPKRTKKGAVAHKRVLGFEEFIKRARGQELDWMTKKQPDMALFEAFLPHAVAFNLTREWASAFENFLQEAPSWYHTSGGRFYFYNFGSDFSHITESMASAATTPPRSSGGSGGNSGFGGGGGFSGGGFGGGGGGSW